MVVMFGSKWFRWENNQERKPKKAPPPTSYSLSDFVRQASNPPLCANVHTETIIQSSLIICFSLVIPGPLFQTSVWFDLSATSLWRILGGSYVTGKAYKLAFSKKIRSSYVKNKSKQTSKWRRKRDWCEKGVYLQASWEELIMGTLSVPTWPGFQTAEDLIIIWLFISLRISAPGKPPMWAGTLGLEPSPNLLFHWTGGGFVLLDGSWAGQWPVTLSRPTRLWECADTLPRTLTKLRLLNPPRGRGRGPWENDQKSTCS